MSDDKKITIHLSEDWKPSENHKQDLKNRMKKRILFYGEKCSFLKRLVLHFVTATISALILGLLLGITVLQMIETNATLNQVNPQTKVDRLTYTNDAKIGELEAYDLFFVQAGVFTKKDSVLHFKENTDALVYKQNEKYYVLTNVHDKNTFQKDEIEKKNKEIGNPYYVYEAQLSKKIIKGNVLQFKGQRKALIEMLNDVDQNQAFSETKYKKWENIFLVDTKLTDEKYITFLKEMRHYLQKYLKNKGENIQKADFLPVFFAYYLWNEDLDID